MSSSFVFPYYKFCLRSFNVINYFKKPIFLKKSSFWKITMQKCYNSLKIFWPKYILKASKKYYYNTLNWYSRINTHTQRHTKNLLTQIYYILYQTYLNDWLIKIRALWRKLKYPAIFNILVGSRSKKDTKILIFIVIKTRFQIDVI